MTLEDKFWTHVGRHSDHGCWEWMGSKFANGYGQFRRKGWPTALAHRVSWYLAHGTLPERSVLVMHICDNRACVNPQHLRLGSHRDNAADMVSKGRALTGERQPAAVLTASRVAAMRRMYVDGAKQQDLAEAFGVTQTQVSRIVRGSRWKHLPVGSPRPMRRSRGESHLCAKLTEDIVRTIRRNVGIVPYTEMAQLYGVSPVAIRAAALGKTWTHVTS